MRRSITLLVNYKTTVRGNAAHAGHFGTPSSSRFWTLIFSSYCSQITTYQTGENFEDAPMVETALVPMALTSLPVDVEGEGSAVTVLPRKSRDVYQDESRVDDPAVDWSLVVAVDRDSPSDRNLKAGSVCSLTMGASNPQIVHFFKQLEAMPWRSLISGRASPLEGGPVRNEVWAQHFEKNALLRGRMIAETKKKRLNKFGLPVTASDEEAEDDTAYLTPDKFVLYKFLPENGFLCRPQGGMDKIPLIDIPPPRPLYGMAQQWLTRMNTRRDLVVDAVRECYNIDLRFLFVFHIDSKGMYVMGLESSETEWKEYFLEWGPDMEFSETRELKGWWGEFLQRAGPASDSETYTFPKELTD